MSEHRTGREVHLRSRPEGWPTPHDFAVVEVPVAEPAAGEVLVHNRYLSVDPYMRGRMNEGKSYVPPYRVGAVMDGGAVGEVVASQAPELTTGDTVLHPYGWREYATGAAGRFRKVDAGAAPLSAYLGVLGMPGLTAYIGMLDIAGLREGDTAFVSGAAGAVGSLAGQIAKLRGAQVVGSAGSADKVAYLKEELGFHAAFNYKDEAVRHQLARAAPQGIDVYFDNVGGDHLEAAIGAMRERGRIAACGAIGQYNATELPGGPRNMGLFIGRRLTMRGFIVGDHFDRMPEFTREVGDWLRAGRIAVRETVVEGIEGAVEAFLGLLRGQNTGKMVVRV